ncbi:MAG: prephenate dehydrogenase/arogenate dehydrogenase family protein [Burkholderiaceae bacterium]
MKLALVGVGLIGGSFAQAIRHVGMFERIVGFDSNADSLQRALALGVIDQAAGSLAHAVDGATLVMIATPVGSTRQVLRAISPHLSHAAITTDVGSVKASVVDAAREELGSSFARFVPGHPIAGSEGSGVEHATPELFRDKIFVTTAVSDTDPSALLTVESLWRAAGCRIERMAADEHDQIFAAVSHLPHLLAFSLVAQIANDADAERKFAMSGAGFRDFTRIAASSSAMWRDICLDNRAALGRALREQRALLEKIQRAVDDGDAHTLEGIFSKASINARNFPVMRG